MVVYIFCQNKNLKTRTIHFHVYEIYEYKTVEDTHDTDLFNQLLNNTFYVNHAFLPERPGGVKIAKMIPSLTGRPCVRSNFTSVLYPQQMEHCPSHVTTR